MNFIKATSKYEVIILPFENGFIIPKEFGDFSFDGRNQLSEHLDHLLFSFYRSDLFANTPLEAINNSILCVRILLEYMLEMYDERDESFNYWSKLSVELKELTEELKK